MFPKKFNLDISISKDRKVKTILNGVYHHIDISGFKNIFSLTEKNDSIKILTARPSYAKDDPRFGLTWSADGKVHFKNWIEEFNMDQNNKTVFPYKVGKQTIFNMYIKRKDEKIIICFPEISDKDLEELKKLNPPFQESTITIKTELKQIGKLPKNVKKGRKKYLFFGPTTYTIKVKNLELNYFDLSFQIK